MPDAGPSSSNGGQVFLAVDVGTSTNAGWFLRVPKGLPVPADPEMVQLTFADSKSHAPSVLLFTGTRVLCGDNAITQYMKLLRGDKDVASRLRLVQHMKHLAGKTFEAFMKEPFAKDLAGMEIRAARREELYADCDDDDPTEVPVVDLGPGVPGMTALEYTMHQMMSLVNAVPGRHNEDVINVVLAHPQVWDVAARRMLRKAADLLHINVLAMISEPVAIALALLHRDLAKFDVQAVIILDIGGGTADFALVIRQREADGSWGTPEVFLAGGNRKLGGHLVTRELVDMLLGRLRAAKAIELEALEAEGRLPELRQVLTAAVVRNTPSLNASNDFALISTLEGLGDVELTLQDLKDATERALMDDCADDPYKELPHGAQPFVAPYSGGKGIRSLCATFVEAALSRAAAEGIPADKVVVVLDGGCAKNDCLVENVRQLVPAGSTFMVASSPGSNVSAGLKVYFEQLYKSGAPPKRVLATKAEAPLCWRVLDRNHNPILIPVVKQGATSGTHVGPNPYFKTEMPTKSTVDIDIYQGNDFKQPDNNDYVGSVVIPIRQDIRARKQRIGVTLKYNFYGCIDFFSVLHHADTDEPLLQPKHAVVSYPGDVDDNDAFMKVARGRLNTVPVSATLSDAHRKQKAMMDGLGEHVNALGGVLTHLTADEKELYAELQAYYELVAQLDIGGDHANTMLDSYQSDLDELSDKIQTALAHAAALREEIEEAAAEAGRGSSSGSGSSEDEEGGGSSEDEEGAPDAPMEAAARAEAGGEAAAPMEAAAGAEAGGEAAAPMEAAAGAEAGGEAGAGTTGGDAAP